MRVSVEERLKAMGITLEGAVSPVANYLGTKQVGDTLYVSARVSRLTGVVGGDVSPAAAYEAARDTAVMLLAIVAADVGDLDRVSSVDYVRGFVRSAPDFDGQPKVIDGASDLLVEIFGDRGRHARTATGANQLPYGACVQLEMILSLSSV